MQIIVNYAIINIGFKEYYYLILSPITNINNFSNDIVLNKSSLTSLIFLYLLNDFRL